MRRRKWLHSRFVRSGEVQALEGRKHAELKLDVVLGGGDEGSEVVVGVLGDLDLEVLCSLVKAMQ